MQTWTRSALALVVGVSVLPAAWAQIPVPPAGAAPVPGAAAAPAPAAPAGNLWSFLCPSAAQTAACKAKFCASPLGQLASAAGAPLALISGGLLGNCCPLGLPNPNDLNKPADSSEGAAALIKQDEADAKARRLAIRYLGTVDCRYWPEAEAALINGLRADKNECVRWEAAMALQRGCCCSPKIIEALSICVSGSERDGHPAEHSERVREAAAIALSLCVPEGPLVAGPIGVPIAPVPPPPVLVPQEQKLPVPREVPGPVGAHGPSEYYQRVTAAQRGKIVAEARRALAQYYQRGSVPSSAAVFLGETRPSAGGLFGLVSHAVGTPAPATAAGTPATTAEPPMALGAGFPTPPAVATAAAKQTPAPTPAPAAREPERSGLLYMAYTSARGNGGGSAAAASVPGTATGPLAAPGAIAPAGYGGPVAPPAWPGGAER